MATFRTPPSKHKRFKQLHLKPNILEAGAFSQTAVAVPWEPLATLGWRPETFTEKLGIEFQDSFDDLDVLRLAVLRLWTGRSIALIQYPRRSEPSTIVQVTDEGGASTSDIVKEVTDALNVPPDEVTWQRPD